MEDSSTSTPPQHQKEQENAFDQIVRQASSSSSTLTKKGPCDVFVNHRGCDVKHTLASTIYHTLDLVGLRAFLDVEELELGDSIPDEIQEAMRTAALHIAIFSENYALSPWCLAELSFMLKTGTTILPVFYRVKPNDLRSVGQGKGLYAPAFSHYKKKRRYSSSMLEEWERALHNVSYLSGYMLNNNEDEGKLLKSIVNSVLGRMKRVPLEVAKHPVAMDEVVKDFERSVGKSIQSEQHVQIVGIVGFGGSGKTTLATELYNRKSSTFNRFSFLHDVRDAASKNSLHTKQKKLLEDLRIQNVTSFDNVKEGKRIVADRLKAICVLIVVDDVDHEDQLDALLPPKESLGSGSLIIVTTREGRVLTKCGITSIHAMQPLQHFHAKQLFCWHAFLQPYPQEGFDELVDFFLKICSGLPLSLKIIGGQLYGRNSMEYWYAQLDKIRRTLPQDIKAILKVSFDALDRDEQNVFLDIACFFIGEERSLAIPVWDGSGWSGLCSLEALLNKCLVEVDKEGRIRMHDHLRDLGKEIATTSSPSRFWFRRQSMPIQRGIPIRGIMAVAGRRQNYDRLECPPPFKQCMEMMRSSNLGVGLQLLVVEENDFTQECGELSRGLLWLRWLKFEHGNIPSWLSLEHIRVLQLLQAWKLEALWDEAYPPKELRELLIENAQYFRSLPQSISHLTNLKRLSLVCCGGLSSLPEECCQLQSLEHLDLKECLCLHTLPSRFGNLVNLRHINLSRCQSLEMLPVSFKQLIHLEYLNLSSCYEVTVESNILENISNLKVFDVSGCHKLELLPHNITNQASLGKLDLRYTSSLRELPASIGQLSKIKRLEIFGSSLLTKLPTSLGNLSSLTTLTINDCKKLESLPIEVRLLYSLQTLTIVRCPELYEMPSLVGLVSLNSLAVRDCHKIKKIEGLEHLTSLGNLLVWTCWMIPGINSLRGTERLRMLNLRADNISAFVPCIQSIQMENWPLQMTICGRIFPRVQSILDSFTFPGLSVVNSLETVHCYLDFIRWSLTSWEANLSNAAILCFLVRSCQKGSILRINEEQSSRISLSEGEWIVISVMREIYPLIKDGGCSFQAWINVDYDRLDFPHLYPDFPYLPPDVYGGWLIVGDRGSIVEGFKKLFQTLCKATSMN